MYLFYFFLILGGPIFVCDFLRKPHERKSEFKVLVSVRLYVVRHTKCMSKYFKIINGTKDYPECEEFYFCIVRPAFKIWCAIVCNCVECVVYISRQQVERYLGSV